MRSMIFSTNNGYREQDDQAFNLIQKNLKKDIALLIAFVMGGLSVYFSYPYLDPSWQVSNTQNSQYRVCFSPHGNCTALIEAEISKATESILVQAYSFTSPDIANALIKAHQRGVEVSILVDKSQKHEKYTQIYNLITAGIPLYIDKIQGIAHNSASSQGWFVQQESVLSG